MGFTLPYGSVVWKASSLLPAMALRSLQSEGNSGNRGCLVYHTKGCVFPSGPRAAKPCPERDMGSPLWGLFWFPVKENGGVSDLLSQLAEITPFYSSSSASG